MPRRPARALLLLAALAVSLLVPSAAPAECDPLAPAPSLAAGDLHAGDCCDGDATPCGCCPQLRPLLSAAAAPVAGATPGIAVWQDPGASHPSVDPRGVLHVPKLPAPPTRPV